MPLRVKKHAALLQFLLPTSNQSAQRTWGSCVRSYRGDLFDLIFNQFAADFDVMREWCAGTQLPDPLFSNQIRKFPEAKYRNVNSVSFAGLLVFDEITPASGTVMLNERFTGFDFYLPPPSAGPLMAVPCVAIHGK
jgi:hypothetical protein